MKITAAGRCFAFSMIVACLPAAGGFAMTSGGSSGSDSAGSSESSQADDALLAQAQAAIDSGDYQGALSPLNQIVAQNPGNADAFNLLGYATRSLNQLSDARAYYEQALAIEPEHLGANEYYGELLLKLGDLNSAQERLAILDEVCFLGCDEYDALEAAIETYLTAE